MLLCLVVPMLIRLLLQQNWSSQLKDWLQPLLELTPWGTVSIRTIEYTTQTGRRSIFTAEDLDSTDRNNVLQKAIRLYMNQTLNVNTSKMESNLVPCKRIETEKEDYMGISRSVFSGSYKQLRGFIVAKLPQKSTWTLVDPKHGISFRHFDKVEKNGQTEEMTSKSIFFQVKAHGKDAGKRIDEFIDRAFDWYSEHKRMEQEADQSRYFFLSVNPEGADKDENKKQASTQFKQYVLSDHKKFGNLFFPGKAELLRLVDDFMQDKGKFAIDGFPRKLGLLLSGPPGTGKTSLIKALAQYTGRHIVSVNLARIKTNQELMDLIFDLHFPVHGQDLPLKMKFSDVIFVMEDVDAASKVVFARQKSAKPAATNDGPGAPPELVRASTGGAEEQESSKEVGTAAVQVMEALADAVFASSSESDDVDVKRSFCGFPSVSRYSCKPDDELNLAGLLNVLDGVVDSPGRILVMTTNHPERLDAALIRPGRINRKLHLGYMDGEALCAMVSHYLCISLSIADRTALETVATSVCLTPAQVEQECAEADTLAQLIDSLWKLSSA
eukprot:TRINITY_DN10575_c0_g1_i1.p1 TRINITY_DN10575_c0_g1~~TRINITY_DN10575_c0_g1_i1.p1  ORF type:complete len:604 (-),score=135.72 TRINITY_DN10575_c0_g1_i1:28-1689(-)